MKNRINIFIILFLAISAPLSAQKGLWYGGSLGIQDTYLRSWIRSEIDTKDAFRPLASVNIEYEFASGASFQSGIGYSLFTQNTSKFKNNFNYLSIPVFLKGGTFKNDEKIALSYFCGFTNYYLLSAQNIFQGEKNNINKYTQGFHQDIAVGFGMKYKIKDNILLETYLTGAVGGYINRVSLDGFALINMNYGITFNLKYRFKEQSH